MKLISIKCPNCGGNLNLNQDDKIIKCTYCHSQIFIDDTDINLNKKDNEIICNSLKLANIFFEDGEYQEAYLKYDQVLILEPDNYEAIFKRGLCITLNSNYLNFEVESSLNGFKNSVCLLKNSSLENDHINNIINNYALELLVVILKIKEFIIEFYNQHLFTKNELNSYINRLYSCLYILEKVYCLYELDNKTKSKYNRAIYELKKEIKKSKKYSDLYDVETGNPVILKYTLPNKECKKLNRKIKRYKQDMLIMDKSFKLKYESLKKQSIIIVLVEILLITLFVMMCINYKNILWNIVILMDIILFSFDIFSKELLKENNFLLVIKILIALIAIIGYLIN